MSASAFTGGWAIPERLAPPAEGVAPPIVAIGGDGATAATWTRTRYVRGGRERIGSSRVLAAIGTAEGGFGAPEMISGAGELTFGSDVAAVGAGFAVASFAVSRELRGPSSR